jgi:glycosyltransferase involved in cell wall biosynthesis
MKKEFVITIVIPTRNRVETLSYCLKTIITQNDKNLQVLVCDNSTNNETQSLVSKLNYPITYIRTKSLLSMTENWNYAMKFVDGDYVIYIGDDDGIAVDGISNLRKVIKESNELAFTWNTCEYQWPIDEFNAKVISEFTATEGYEKYDLRRKARDVMCKGGWFYYELPGLYHSCIAYSIIDKIIKKNGSVFKTTQPDLFSAMSIPNYTNKYVFINKDITIQGRSALSNGGSSVSKNGQKNVKNYISEFGNYEVVNELRELPFHMSWFFEPFVMSSNLFEVYSKTTVNYSAMIAFGYRIGFIDFKYLFFKLPKLDIFGKINILNMISYILFHILVKYRRILITKYKKKSSQKISCNNIYEYSLYLNNKRIKY